MSPEFAKAITTFSHPHNSEDSDSDCSPPSSAVVGRPSPLRTTPTISSTKITTTVGKELVSGKKPRGRPPGSKNRPKPPVVITRDCDSSMKTVVLEISAGSDVIEMITSFALKRRVGITLLSGSGSVLNVTLRHSVSHAPNSLVSLQGPFHLLSLWGSFMGFKTPAAGRQIPDFSPAGECSDFSITLSGVQGQVFGGVVGGKVVAAGQVIVVATTYVNPPLESLASTAHGREEDEEELPEARASIGGSVGRNSVPLTADVKPWSGGRGSSSCISRSDHI